MSTDTDAVDDVLGAVTVTHAPARLSSVLAAVCALLAVLTSAPATILALGIGVIGLGGFLAGQFALHSRRLAGAGTALIFAAVVVSGMLDNAEVFVTFAALATVLAFDLSQNAFSVGTQLSTATETHRGEVIHAAASLFVGAIAMIVAFAVYLAVGGEQTVAALVFVLLGAILLVWAIRS